MTVGPLAPTSARCSSWAFRPALRASSMNDRMLQIEPRANIKTSRQLVVRLGRAPDGIELLLAIDRGQSPDHLLQPVARMYGFGDDARSWTSHLKQLSDELTAMHDKGQFFEASALEGDANTTYFLSVSDLRSLLGPTLLERLSRDQAGIVSHAPLVARNGASRGTKMNYGTVSQMLDHQIDEDTDHLQERVKRFEEMSSSKFALDVNSERVAIARAPKAGVGTPEIERSFTEESLLYFDSVRCRASFDGSTVEEGRPGPDYQKDRQEPASRSQRW